MRSATTGVAPARQATLLRTGVVTLAAVLAGVLLAVPALAAPETTEPPSTSSSAAAVVDPTRPTARIVHGPNCTDGYVRVEVTNGTADRTMTLQYDGADVGSPAMLAPGGQTTLEGPEVAGGATVAVQVAVTGADGPEDPLPLSSYTRPTQAECDAVDDPTPTSPPSSPPTSLSTSPPTSGTTAPTTPTTLSTTPAPSTSRPPTSAPSSPTTSPAPSSDPTATQPTQPAPSSAAVPPGGTASAGQVSPGSVVTVRGTGFAPGEPVTVTFVGSGAPLATVTADDQGRVEAVVQIPRDVVLGTAVVQLVGEQSAAATQVALDIAARERTEVTGSTPWPLFVAGLALLAVAAALVAATRRPRADDWQPPADAA